MNVLVVGSGGREHALAWKSRYSEVVDQVFVAPGNAGTASDEGLKNISINAEDIESLLEFAKNESIDLTIVGPEGPLVAGIVDRFSEEGLKCFGPTARAAQLEGSKTFAKDFLADNQIPTAAYRSFVDVHDALSYLDGIEFPVVVKADGLAAGKGVVIAETRHEAKKAVEDMLSSNRFGDAGSTVVIEEFLEGEEVSYICIVDGENILPMATSQDHKAAYEGDMGPNTGGMGAYSPAAVVDERMHQVIMEQVMIPTVQGLRKMGIHYVGFLYAGLMIGKDGCPRVLEFNCRFGDPETQPIMMRLKSDLVLHCLAAIDGRLNREKAVWDDRPALGVVLASEGYPGSYKKGLVISGLDTQLSNSSSDESSGITGKLFHAGTDVQSGNIITAGGRVICSTALGGSLLEAQKAAYALAESVSWDGCWYRRDIGFKALGR
ncbi:MAG: phosphoribosylamine--glycine ligase [Gammaproteobacteria bacterium]|nr:phosphoribosylamine--glycine ligase [Gammaproteobacteria bacterium]NKB65101.1 phosphoribosylamine--glycine ligase [Gammaproteobacteria bacterium]